MTSHSLQDSFGGIDIYLFDQLLKGRLVPGMRLLDAVRDVAKGRHHVVEVELARREIEEIEQSLRQRAVCEHAPRGDLERKTGVLPAVYPAVEVLDMRVAEMVQQAHGLARQRSRGPSAIHDDVAVSIRDRDGRG